MKVEHFFSNSAAGSQPLGAGERLTLSIAGRGFRACHLVARTTILADADNRAVEIVAESDDFIEVARFSSKARAARTTTFEFRSLPSGTYEVRANLLGADGLRAMIRQHQRDCQRGE
jgi:hypothetical protein